MGNRKIQMHEYRHIIYRLRQGESERSIARDGLAGRPKIKIIRAAAEAAGWLKSEACLPKDEELATFFEQTSKSHQKALAAPYQQAIEQWAEQGINAQVIYGHLVEQHGFTGSYNSVQRFIKKLTETSKIKLTVPLHFKPGEAVQIYRKYKRPFLIDQDLSSQNTGRPIKIHSIICYLGYHFLSQPHRDLLKVLDDRYAKTYTIITYPIGIAG